jgi:deoxyribose-phosphate aldolase
MLIIKGILNRIIGVIISIKASGKVKTVFLTKNRIKVSAFNIALL